jgi:hypothetical protein
MGRASKHEQYPFKRFRLKRPDGAVTTVCVPWLDYMQLVRRGLTQKAALTRAQELFDQAWFERAKSRSAFVAAGLAEGIQQGECR